MTVKLQAKPNISSSLLLLGVLALFLLASAQQYLFTGVPNFWLGAQAGVLGAVLSIAIFLRNRTVGLNIGFAGNLSESALRLSIGALCGGTLVLLFATGLVPALHTWSDNLNGTLPSDPHNQLGLTAFVVVLGIIAGFVEQLVPSLLEDQSKRFRNGDSPGSVTMPTKTG